MKRVFFSLVVFLMSGLMAVQVVEAQNRRAGGNPTQSSATRPGRNNTGSSGNSRPASGGSTATRPGSTGSQSGSAVRPGSNGSSNQTKPANGLRPGNNGNHNVAPAKPSAPVVPSKPAQSGHVAPVRPGNTPGYRPAAPVAPAVRPVRPGAVSRPPVLAPPVRPGRPVLPVWTRPVPPGNWRPTYRYNLVNGFLGLSFGINITSALDHFYNTGYTVDGYGTKEVYLRNVSELGYNWEDATLFFESGGLVRSQFYESTASYYPTRFNSLFTRLSNQYGNPVEYSNSGSSQSAVWFGYNGDYVSLQYTLMNTGNGYRYFTVLTYGN